MHKQGFIDHIANQHGCTKKEAEKAIDVFTSSVIDAMGEGKEISLVGFGHFTINKVAAKIGRNPKTRESVNVPAYKQPKFKAGQKLKDAVNAK